MKLSPSLKDCLFAKPSDHDKARHGGGDVVKDGGLQLVVQLLTVINPTVHGRVEEDDETDYDDKGDGEVGIKETNHDDIDENQQGVLTSSLHEHRYLSVH